MENILSWDFSTVLISNTIILITVILILTLRF